VTIGYFGKEKNGEVVFIPKGIDREKVCLKRFSSKWQPCPSSLFNPFSAPA
jgi:hypothetical protein